MLAHRMMRIHGLRGLYIERGGIDADQAYPVCGEQADGGRIDRGEIGIPSCGWCARVGAQQDARRQRVQMALHMRWQHP